MSVLELGLSYGPGEVRWIKASDLRVDDAYQNPVNPRKVNTIALQYDPILFKPLDVSRRSDGTYWVIDGRHRLEAIRSRGETSKKLECRVYEGMSIKDEASLYLKLDRAQTKKPSAYRFRSRLAANDPFAVSVSSVVKAAGYSLNLSRQAASPQSITCISAIESVLAMGGTDHLYSVLRLIKDIWGGRDHSTGEPIIKAVHAVLLLHGGEISRKTIISRLSKRSPLDVLAESRNMSGFSKNNSFYSVYLVMVLFYNQRTPDAKRVIPVPKSSFSNALRKASREVLSKTAGVE